MSDFGYKLPSKEFDSDSDYCCYDESDTKFFDDLFYAAAGNKKMDDDKDKKDFLLGGFKYPSQSFQLCTRDIVVFWGRVTSQLWDKGLKDRFISQKNQDCKIFLKNLCACLLDTLKFEFDESWTGIIKVRTEVVRRLELIILSYFDQTEIAQKTAGEEKKKADADVAQQQLTRPRPWSVTVTVTDAPVTSCHSLGLDLGLGLTVTVTNVPVH
jgi:hypothetical protein